MPGMTGTEFIHRIKDIYPETTWGPAHRPIGFDLCQGCDQAVPGGNLQSSIVAKRSNLGLNRKFARSAARRLMAKRIRPPARYKRMMPP